MKAKLVKGLALALLSFTALTGCANQDANQIDTLNEKLVQLETTNKELQTSIQELEKEVDALTTENNSLLLEIESITKVEYTLYTRDVDSWEIIETEKVKVDKNVSIEEKLQTLANALSKTEFDGLEIEVQDIKKINGDEIAMINLKDAGEGDNTWERKYFQGSAGGEITNTAIQETFLQKEMKEDWIDGIKILYNGEEMMSSHMTLGPIIYRNK
ncbi:MAG: hypothetical protein ACRCWY_08245 [Cellulosilyticaceae bacterium]